MNWPATAAVSARQDGDDACEHVESGTATPVLILREMDSFGPVAGLVVCKACLEEQRNAAEEELEICHDCGKEHKAKDGISYKWFDFYPQQGDEPLQICNECRDKSTHQAREERDRKDMEAEYGPEDDYYDDIDWDDDDSWIDEPDYEEEDNGD